MERMFPNEFFGNDAPWDVNDYAWDPHKLTARPKSYEDTSKQSDPANGGGDVGASDPSASLDSTPGGKTCKLAKGPLICQVEGCAKDLLTEKGYYQRYRVCEQHLKMLSLMVDGKPSRFCQQCGRFHELHEFDGNKRSCRARLQQHNARRRKRSSPAPQHPSPTDERSSGSKRRAGKLSLKDSVDKSNSGEQQTFDRGGYAFCKVEERSGNMGLGSSDDDSNDEDISPCVVSGPSPNHRAPFWDSEPPSEHLQGFHTNRGLLPALPPDQPQQLPFQQTAAHSKLSPFDFDLPTNFSLGGGLAPSVSDLDPLLQFGGTNCFGMSGQQFGMLNAFQQNDFLAPPFVDVGDVDMQDVLPAPMDFSRLVAGENAPVRPQQLAQPSWPGGSRNADPLHSDFPFFDSNVAPAFESPHSLGNLNTYGYHMHQQSHLDPLSFEPSNQGYMNHIAGPSGVAAVQPKAEPAEPSCFDLARMLVSGRGNRSSYKSNDLLVRLSIKIANCRPEELPPDLHHRLQGVLAQSDTSFVQGFLRPGCTLLTMDLSVPRCCACRSVQRGCSCTCLESLNSIPAAKYVQVLGPPLEQAHPVLVQIADKAILVENGRETWHDSSCEYGSARVLHVSPVSACVGSTASLVAFGQGLNESGVQLYVRFQGQFLSIVEVQQLALSSVLNDVVALKNCGIEVDSAVRVVVSGVASSGLGIVECQQNHMLGSWRPVLFVDNVDVAKELALRALNVVLERRGLSSVWELITDLGLCLNSFSAALESAARYSAVSSGLGSDSSPTALPLVAAGCKRAEGTCLRAHLVNYCLESALLQTARWLCTTGDRGSRGRDYPTFPVSSCSCLEQVTIPCSRHRNISSTFVLQIGCPAEFVKAGFAGATAFICLLLNWLCTILRLHCTAAASLAHKWKCFLSKASAANMLDICCHFAKLHLTLHKRV